MNRWFLVFVLVLLVAFVGVHFWEIFGEDLPPGTIAAVRPLHVNRLSGVQKANFYGEDGLNDRLAEWVEVRVLTLPPPKRRPSVATPERVRVEVLTGVQTGHVGYMAHDDLGPPQRNRRRKLATGPRGPAFNETESK